MGAKLYPHLKRVLLTLVAVHTVSPGLQAQLLEAWGWDSWGQVSDTPVGTEFVQIDGGVQHSIALGSDGSIIAWGYDAYGQVSKAPSGGGFTSVAAGSYHSHALRPDGSIASWGRNTSGEIFNTPGEPGFVQVAGGGQHSLALKADGSIVSWGYDAFGQVSATPTGTDFVQVAAGTHHSIALRSDSSIASWGMDDSGQITNTPAGGGFVQVAAGLYGSAALRADGTIVQWGDTRAGAPTAGGFTQVAVGWYFSVAVHADGSIWAWGSDQFGEVSQSPTGKGYEAVATNGFHAVALRGPKTGTAYCTPGTSASGCRANIAAVATPSASAPSGFFILAGEVEGAKDGMFFYGTNGRQAWTWGTGFQCVVPPVNRGPLQPGIGTAGGCDGAFVLDLNARWCPTCPKSHHNPGPGAVVQAQFWYRDPWNTATTKTTTLSDAIEFTVGP